MNRLKELHRFGVSVWYDNISRALLESGELKRLIEEDGIRGVTSNPTIFEKAIGSSADYDAAIARWAPAGKTPQELFEKLAVADIQEACDLFAALHDDSGKTDGYVSLEVSPALARDAKATHAEALRLRKLVDRDNVMIKIPGTKEGLKAVEASIADGVPVNVTLLFSLRRYEEVVEAYLRGLEKRAAKGKDLRGLASVASFFISRVDAVAPGAAIPNAKAAYRHWKKAFSSPRFSKLKEKGAQAQRLLWASTGTKNPALSDVIYVEELVGPATVNTMPPATVDAFRDHGRCRPSLEEPFAAPEIPEAALQKLEDDGVKAFAQSWEALMGRLAAKRELVLAESQVTEAGLKTLKKARFSERLWQKDPSLWKKEKEHQKVIKNSLGWLTAPEALALNVGQLRQFAEEVRKEGFERVVVLGMGGSSLGCEVLARCFPAKDGWPKLMTLDSTNPDDVARIEARRTLFVVSSKSGGTIEPNAMLAHFWEQTKREARQFVAITDAHTSLEDLARSRGFRRVFINPSDVGGRFSVLTYFGLVPAALAGIDPAKLLERARSAARLSRPSTPTEESPALRLGALLGQNAKEGRDKLTLTLPPAFESFGLWIEQLVAESTGKEGTGLLPVHGEPSAPAGAGRPGKDRLFVDLGRDLKDPYDLGEQFMTWEIATAAAGFILGVNPFDQPDVQKAKDQTKALLSRLEKGKLPAEKADFQAGGLAAFTGRRGSDRSLSEALGALAGGVKDGGYLVILAYCAQTDENRRSLAKIQELIRAVTAAPVLLQWGPRYLHSTGQLYKGGRAGGAFLMLVEQNQQDLPVPGESFSFGTLFRAQARGDYAALLEAKRGVLRLELGPSGSKPLAAVANAAASLNDLCRR